MLCWVRFGKAFTDHLMLESHRGGHFSVSACFFQGKRWVDGERATAGLYFPFPFFFLFILPGVEKAAVLRPNFERSSCQRERERERETGDRYADALVAHTVSLSLSLSLCVPRTLDGS